MEATRSALVEENLPLVRGIVRQVAANFPRHVDRQELMHAGTLGLVEAARRWDPDRGVPFGRFVAQRVKGAMLDAVRAADWAPRSVRHQAREVEEARSRLAERLGVPPCDAEVAAEMGISLAAFRALSARLACSTLLTLDQTVESDHGDPAPLGATLADVGALDPCEVLERRELQAYMLDAVELLPDPLRGVIVGHFLEGKRDDELAGELGVTKSRISQLRTEALRRLRDALDAQYDGTAVTPDPDGGRVCARKAAFAASVATASPWRRRLDPPSPPAVTASNSRSA